MTQTHSLQGFGVIPFVKRQNDTYTTVKRLKTVKNDRLIFCLVGGGGGEWGRRRRGGDWGGYGPI